MASSAIAALHSLLFAVLLCFSSVVDAAVQSSDLQQLLSFRSKLPNPDVLPSWHPSGDPCSSFSGVSCGGSSSRVVSIRLDSVLLNADIRNVYSFLLPMDGLESLSLRAANLTGSLSPAPASGLRCGGLLAELDLSSNELRGSVSDIPFLTSSCSNLRSLNLSGNVLGGAGAGDGGGFFPADTGHRLSLGTLDLSNNKISSSSALGWLFLSATEIRHLDVSGNALTGAIPAIANCSALRHLDLASNTLSEISTGAFSSCNNLEFLNLSSNHLTGNGEFPAGLFGTCRGLLQLDMSYNNFYGKLPSDISACSSLESINLSNNNFSGDLPVLILTSMPGLRRIELGFNNFTGKLLDSLSETTNIELLDLSSNSLSGSIPPELCRGVAGLKELYLQSNKLTGSIPASISNCSTLVSLDLSFNYFTGRIPPSIGSITSLHDLILWQNMLEGEIPSELGSLGALENLILDNNALSGPIPDGLENCTRLNWISLSSNSLSGSIPPWIGKLSNLAILKMGNNSLSGPIPPEIGDCKSLIWLDLNSNQLNGTIPPTMSRQSGKIAVGLVTGKRFVYLRNDGSSECHGSGNLLEFAGIRQEQLEHVPTRRSCNFTRVYIGNTNPTFKNNGSIIFMDLSYNRLEGEIPKELGDMFYINILNLGHNALSGPIPTEFGRLKFLGILDLSHNSLEGPIPSSFAGCAMLSEIDLSYNNLSGPIPDVGQLATFPPAKYQNNPELCGFPLPACGSNSSNSEIKHERSHRRQASLAGSVAMGLLFSLFCIFGLLIILVESRKRQRKRKEANDNNGNNPRDIYIDGRTQSVVLNSAWKFTSTREALSINLSTFENPLRKLTFQDLLEATNGFHNDSLVGSGGFGDVYKAQLKDGSVVAIKKLIHVSGQGDREFTAEMETIGKIKHRNLVPLLGYCKVGEERLLVYEYMKYGSLEDVLHNRKKSGVKLNWATRRKIAVGAARGLAFLHHNCIPHIIHRDMKSSNVLIDDSLEARVSDFGMARLMSAMDTHLSVSTLAGTPGYVPPEYYQSFRCSTKGDVYSYGVVLLELLTGKQPTDSADFGDNNLVGWVKQHCKLRITDVFDSELIKEDPSLELELLEHLKIACACLDDRPLRRPTMLKVMAMFKEIQAGSTVDSAVSAATAVGSVDGGFGMVEMSLKECKEEKE